VIVEGFEGEVNELGPAFSSIGWPPDALSESAAYKKDDDWCILVVDLRVHTSERHQTLTRIEAKSRLAGTAVFLLTERGDAMNVGGNSRRGNRWFFTGRISPDGLAVLMNSILQVWATWAESPSGKLVASKAESSEGSAVAYAEGD
jgi:hypothetical protein